MRGFTIEIQYKAHTTDICTRTRYTTLHALLSINIMISCQWYILYRNNYIIVCNNHDKKIFFTTHHYYHCGGSHLASRCKFHMAECHQCHKTGRGGPNKKSHHSGKKIHHYLEQVPGLPDTNIADSSYVWTIHPAHNPILVHAQLELNSTPTTMELDTEVLINKVSLYKMCNKMVVLPSRKYTGESAKILGITIFFLASQLPYYQQCVDTIKCVHFSPHFTSTVVDN